MIARVLALLLAALLVASALSLVTAQHRARNVFAELERAQQQTRQLDAEGNRLQVELGRLSQAGAVDAAARGMGLKPLDPARTVFVAPEGGGAR